MPRSDNYGLIRNSFFVCGCPWNPAPRPIEQRQRKRRRKTWHVQRSCSIETIPTSLLPPEYGSIAAKRAFGVGTCFFPPCTARTEAESTMIREKSIASSARSFSSNTRCNFSSTPARRYWSSRFHSVMPEQPISRGKSSHGMPVRAFAHAFEMPPDS